MYITLYIETIYITVSNLFIQSHAPMRWFMSMSQPTTSPSSISDIFRSHMVSADPNSDLPTNIRIGTPDMPGLIMKI